MSLPKPYYDEDGITIYHGVNCDSGCKRKSQEISSEKARRGCSEEQAWAEARVSAKPGTRRKEKPVWSGPSLVEGRRCVSQGRSKPCAKSVPATAMRSVQRRYCGTPPSQWGHVGQLARKYPLLVPKVSHDRGWATR